MREKQKGPPVLEHRRANQGDGLTTHHQKFNTELEDLQMKKKITGSVLSAGAIVLAGLGLVAEQRKEPQKIHKVPENTVKKAACGRKAG